VKEHFSAEHVFDYAANSGSGVWRCMRCGQVLAPAHTVDTWVTKYVCRCGTRFTVPLKEATSNHTDRARKVLEDGDNEGPDNEIILRMWFADEHSRSFLNSQLAMLLREAIDRDPIADTSHGIESLERCFACGSEFVTVTPKDAYQDIHECKQGHQVSWRRPRASIVTPMGLSCIEVIEQRGALRELAVQWLESEYIAPQVPKRAREFLIQHYVEVAAPYATSD
jgi:hypothetical protein